MKTPNKDINIFVSSTKDSYIPENKYLIPLQSNICLSKTNNNTQNKSNIAQYYNQKDIATQYWAYNNIDCDYYGFFCDNQYLSFSEKIGDDWCLRFDNLTDNTLKLIQVNESNIEEAIKNYDIILPLQPKSNISFYQNFQDNPYYDIKDLDKLLEIIQQLHPTLSKYININKQTNNESLNFIPNIYIMKKQYFKEYMEWLLPILDTFDKQKDYTNASYYTLDTCSELSKLLLPIYILYIKDKYSDIKIKETQYVHINDTSNPYLKPLSKNKIAICMATDNNYAKHLGLTITSIALHSSPNNFYDIIVLDNQLSMHHKDKLRKSNLGKKNVSVRFIKTSDYLKNKSLYEKIHINKSCYLRFAIWDLLRNFNKTIYLDCDIIVNCDIANMYDIDLKGNYLAGCRDVVMASWNNQYSAFGDKERKYNTEELKLKNVFNYFNSGVLIIDLKSMKDDITSDYLFNIATSREWDWQDQDVLNYVFSDKTLILHNQWNYMVESRIDINHLVEKGAPKEIFDLYIQAKENPYIIHFAGHRQPMYLPDVDCADIYWNCAKQSLFYEDILAEKYTCNFTPPQKVKLITRLFPANSLRGRFLRKIHKILKRK